LRIPPNAVVLNSETRIALTGKMLLLVKMFGFAARFASAVPVLTRFLSIETMR